MHFSSILEFAEAYMVDYCLRRETHQIDGNQVTVSKVPPKFDEGDPTKVECDNEGNEDDGDQANKDEGERENGSNETENSQKEETRQGDEDPTDVKDENNID